MSPRAACRLEMLGFERVYDYVPGKSDWLAHGLPFEGDAASVPRVGAFARDDVVTCRLEDRVDEVGPRVKGSPYGVALVTTASGTVLGRLRMSAIELAAGEETAGSIMEPGPSTVRPDVRAAELAERLDKRDLTSAIVTTPDGRLLGVVRRDELERAGPQSGRARRRRDRRTKRLVSVVPTSHAQPPTKGTSHGQLPRAGAPGGSGCVS
jgi:hypothetical protein